MRLFSPVLVTVQASRYLGSPRPLYITHPGSLYCMKLSFKMKKRAGHSGISLSSLLLQGLKLEDHDLKTRKSKEFSLKYTCLTKLCVCEEGC